MYIVDITTYMILYIFYLHLFQLRIRAYDTLADYLQSEAQVFISVRRNLNRPVFNPAQYFVTIREDEAVGTFLQKLSVTDPDSVSSFVKAFTFYDRNIRKWK